MLLCTAAYTAERGCTCNQVDDACPGPASIGDLKSQKDGNEERRVHQVQYQDYARPGSGKGREGTDDGQAEDGPGPSPVQAPDLLVGSYKW